MSNKTTKNHLKESAKREKVNYTHIYDEEFFSKIDNEEKAYWLGFIMADGCIKSSNKRGWGLHFFLAEEDGHMVAKLRDNIAPLKDLTLRTPGKRNVQFGIGITIYSNRICYDLIKLNCVPKKSLVLRFPPANSVPKRLMSHFIRGYFDGDGGYMRCRGRLYMKMISSHSFCGTLKKVLEKNGIEGKQYKVNNGKNSIVQIADKIELCRFYRYIYSGANIFLERKRVLFDGWMKENIKGHLDRVFKFSAREQNGRFLTRINLNRTHYYVGKFDTIEEAKVAAKTLWDKLEPLHPPHNKKILDEARLIWGSTE